MVPFVAAVVAALSAPASALTHRQAGPYLDLGVGIGLSHGPLLPSLGGQVSVGGWVGTYDDQYAFGKYWSLGPTARVDWRPDLLGVAPMLELRRGLELIVVGVAPFVAGGITADIPLGDGGASAIGWTGRGGFQFKFRRTRVFGLSLRLEAGVDGEGGRVTFAGGALLGASFARPGQKFVDPEL